MPRSNHAPPAQVLAAIVAVVVLAITVPLFGILMIPVVALTALARAFARTAGTLVPNR